MKKINIHATAISIIIGGIIVWILLSEIDPRDIPRAISKIPLYSFIISFLLYAMAVFLKSLRFKIILGTNISIKQLFPIVSLYMFFANILPMRAGELSYVYFLKKQARTPGTKSFASLIVGGIADFFVIIMAMLIVGWHLRDALAQGFAGFSIALRQRIGVLLQFLEDNVTLFIIFIVFFGIFIVGIAFLWKKTQKSRFLSFFNSKIREVGRELRLISFDFRLLVIVICSILIIVFRFATQWYLIKSMDVGIGLWEMSFALLFGVLFSLVPIHGPAGLGTVEAPWVMALLILNIPRNDAITSGFGLHIIIIIYCIIMGLYGIISMKIKKA